MERRVKLFTLLGMAGDRLEDLQTSIRCLLGQADVPTLNMEQFTRIEEWANWAYRLLTSLELSAGKLNGSSRPGGLEGVRLGVDVAPPGSPPVSPELPAGTWIDPSLVV